MVVVVEVVVVVAVVVVVVVVVVVDNAVDVVAVPYEWGKYESDSTWVYVEFVFNLTNLALGT